MSYVMLAIGVLIGLAVHAIDSHALSPDPARFMIDQEARHLGGGSYSASNPIPTSTPRQRT